MSVPRDPGHRDELRPAAAAPDGLPPGQPPQDAGGQEQLADSAESAESGEAVAADLRARVSALEDRLLRALAEADNLRKQRARDIEEARASARADTVRQLLPVLDNLDRALAHADADPRSIIDGITAVRDQATRLLADLGFSRRDDTGETFDPARHEAVGSRPGAGLDSGTVVEVVRPAYGDGEHQLRPAQVVVAKDS